jgi:hypothetical protein
LTQSVVGSRGKEWARCSWFNSQQIQLFGLSPMPSITNINKRVPVLNPDGSPAMPTKASRARRWVRDGKAEIVQNDLRVFCVQLVAEPSGRNIQDISLGIDPGSCFTGIAIQSKQDTLIGLNLNLPKKQVQKRLAERAILRRTRRGRRIKRRVSFKKRNHRLLSV